MEAALNRWGRAAVLTVLATAVATGVGWATGIDRLTRIFTSWPQMTPWTALLLAALGVAILLQAGHPSRIRVGVARSLAMVVGVLAVVFLAEYATGRSFGLDELLFTDAVRTMQSWPGRPSPQTGSSLLLLSAGVGFIRIERRWTAAAWVLSLLAATTLPIVVISGHVYNELWLTGVYRSTGMGIATAIAIMLLVFATLAVRPDRNPWAWLLARPDPWSLVRLVGVLASFPVLVGLSRRVFLTLDIPDDGAWVLSMLVSIFVVGMATIYLIGSEQRLLSEKYRLLAENAVDVVSHLRGTEVVWISPSVEAAFGWPPEQWIGTDVSLRVNPDDLGIMFAALQEIARGESAFARFRIATADGGYHWVDGHGKPYLDAEGNTDGVITAVRIVDDQVEAQQQLKAEKERFEAVVGHSPSAISVRDLQNRFTMVNEAFCQLFGNMSVDDVVGRTEAEILPPDVLQRSHLAAVRLLSGGGQGRFQGRGVHRTWAREYLGPHPGVPVA